MPNLSQITTAVNERRFSEAIEMVDKELSLLDLARIEGDTARYSFLNTTSFVLFVMLQKETELHNNIVWIADIVQLFYNKAFSLYELGNFHFALEVYKEAEKWDPVGPTIQFEIIECYKSTKQTGLALQNLPKIQNILMEPVDVAHYYRLYGFLYIESEEYQKAEAFLLYSLPYAILSKKLDDMQYSEQQSINSSESIAKAYTELQYIESLRASKKIMNTKLDYIQATKIVNKENRLFKLDDVRKNVLASLYRSYIDEKDEIKSNHYLHVMHYLSVQEKIETNSISQERLVND
jgi:tetratricopeptide (TPR) repeat protein